MNQANLCSKFMKPGSVEGEEISQELAGIVYPCQPAFPQEWGCHRNNCLILPH